jgi:hypothetical protein
MSSLDDVLNFFDKKKEDCAKEDKQLGRAAKTSSSSKINQSWYSKITEDAWAEISSGPLAQLGKDFIAEQVAKNGNLLLNNLESQVDKIVGPAVKTVEQVKDIAFNTVALALTAQKQMGLFFMQQVAKQCVKAIGQKREALLALKEAQRQLYNALMILVAGDPFFSKYLAQLRQALIYTYNAREDVKVVVANLKFQNKWMPVKMASANTYVQEALKLLEPEHDKQPVAKFTDSGLLANVGIPKMPQQLTVLIAIPKLCKDVALAANGYLLANAKVNALLLAYCNGYSELISTSSSIISNFSVGQLSKIQLELTKLVEDMATYINGDPSSVFQPVPGYDPNSVKISAYALEWSVKLRVIYQYMKVVPGKSLDILASTDKAVNAYNESVKKIKAMGTISDRGAILVALEGREEIGQLERQIVYFVLHAMKATVAGSATQTVLAAGRQLQYRFDLSLNRDSEIESILNEFISTDLGFSKQLQQLGNSINTVLRGLGLDRAADFLQQGKFADFFNLNSKTMTYAGAALAGIALLKKCLNKQEDRAKLDNAELATKREQMAKYLSARRFANTGLTLQRSELAKSCAKNDAIQDNVKQTTKKLSGPCGLEFPFSGKSILDTLGPAVGLTLFNTSTAQKALTKYGRGIL